MRDVLYLHHLIKKSNVGDLQMHGLHDLVDDEEHWKVKTISDSHLDHEQIIQKHTGKGWYFFDKTKFDIFYLIYSETLIILLPKVCKKITFIIA